ncbi:MAG: DinB family protein [Thermoanaerobaculia bacterium]
MAMAARFLRWYEYEKDSHEKVLASLAGLDLVQRDEPGFMKALELLAHTTAARRLWLARLGVTKEGPKSLFPHELALESVAGDLAVVQNLWTAYLASLSDSDLERVVVYQSTEGEWFKTGVEDILTQLFGHSWYHRAQVATLVKSMGAAPAITDFIFWCREPIAAP